MFWSILLKVSLSGVCVILVTYLLFIVLNCFKELISEKTNVKNKLPYILISIGALILTFFSVAAVVCAWMS